MIWLYILEGYIEFFVQFYIRFDDIDYNSQPQLHDVSFFFCVCAEVPLLKLKKRRGCTFLCLFNFTKLSNRIKADDLKKFFSNHETIIHILFSFLSRRIEVKIIWPAWKFLVAYFLFANTNFRSFLHFLSLNIYWKMFHYL